MMDEYKRANDTLHPTHSAVERAVKGEASRRKRKPLKSTVAGGGGGCGGRGPAHYRPTRPGRREQWRAIGWQRLCHCPAGVPRSAQVPRRTPRGR